MLQVAYTSRPPGLTSRAAAARMRCCFWASSATASGPCRHLRSGLRRRVPKPLQGASTSTRSSLPARRLARVSLSPESTIACTLLTLARAARDARYVDAQIERRCIEHALCDAHGLGIAATGYQPVP